MSVIIEAARAIGARVVGDDDEEYGPETPLPVEVPGSECVGRWRRVEQILGVWIFIGAWFGAIAMGLCGVSYCFWYN